MADRLTSTESDEGLSILVAKEKLADPNMASDQDVVPVGPLRDPSGHSGSFSSVGDHTTTYLSNSYSSVEWLLPEDGDLKWGPYHPCSNAERSENGSHGIFDEISSLKIHDYGYNPQMPQRPYDRVFSPLPSARGLSQLYNAGQIHASDPNYHQQPAPQNIRYASSLAPVSYPKLPINVELQGDVKRFGLRPNCLHLLGSYGRGSNLFHNSGKLNFSHQGFDSFDGSRFCRDWSKPVNGNSLFHLSSLEASPKVLDSLKYPGNEFDMAAFQKGSFFGFGSCSDSSSRGYSNSRYDKKSDHGSVSMSSFGINSEHWPTLDEARRGKCSEFLCSCTVTLDTLSERNRGPRAFKPKGQTTANGSSVDNCKNGRIKGVTGGSYNQQDFVTDYKHAKFFVIKSYSEDNVHKSIKYSVWASTPSGNKKLDAAYREAKEKHGSCPVFLLFSVNASAQFCGVAEMVGPVDFDRSVDYWLQDKWSGHFPLRWHIIKDVPNSQFRHILLENNDNKPVTNSRDTQEVELDQGMEILKIFKNYESHSSILDDFHFYEERQKAMQEMKARQQTSMVISPEDAVSKSHNSVALPNEIVKKMSKSFAEAVLLSENQKEDPQAGKVSSATTL